jgi:2-dehydropantoate 2-reductase
LQNNIVKESLLAEWAGEAKVLGVSIIEGGTLESPGVVVNHITATTTFYAGELDGTVSPRAEKLVAAMNKAGLPSKAVDCIRQVLWEKLCQICNASAFSASALPANPELTFNEGAVVRAGAEHYVTLGYEILSVYTRMGYTPQNFYAPLSRLKEVHEAKSFDEACDSLMLMAQQLQGKGIRSRTSMHDDVLNHRKSEAPWILKPIIEKAREFGLPVPTLVAVDRILTVLDTYAK